MFHRILWDTVPDSLAFQQLPRGVRILCYTDRTRAQMYCKVNKMIPTTTAPEKHSERKRDIEHSSSHGPGRAHIHINRRNIIRSQGFFRDLTLIHITIHHPCLGDALSEMKGINLTILVRPVCQWHP